MLHTRAVIVLPTFNERGNLEPLVELCARQMPSTHLLIVDDASPDGTGQLADRLAWRHAHVEVLHRPAKMGLASAYVDGFRHARAQDHDPIFQMDADGSHDPVDLARMWVALECHDLVIGSRYVPGGSSEGWARYRRTISRAGSWYARTLLGLPVRDTTSGFKGWRAGMLRRVLARPVEVDGFAFQIVLTHRAMRAQARVTEIPIRFAERQRGRSKFGARIVVEALARVATLALQG